MISKQETLEKAAKNYATDMSGTYYEELDNSFKAGTKRQQKRSYSEEDLMDFGAFIRIEDRKEKRLFLIQDYFKVWFNQFKKK